MEIQLWLYSDKCSGQGWQRHLVYKIVIKWSKVEHYLLLFEMMMKLGMLAAYCYCWTCSLIIVETFGFSWHWHKCCPKHCNRRYRETLVNYHLWWLPKPKRITEKVSLSLHYEWTKDMVHFGEFLNTWSLWSNSVTRQVSFKRTKIGEKCRNSNAKFWVIKEKEEKMHHVFLSRSIEKNEINLKEKKYLRSCSITIDRENYA